MVQVRKTYPKRENGTLDVESWLASLPGFASPDTTARMEVACRLSAAAQSSHIKQGQRPHGLIGCFDAGLEMAGILGSLHMDEEVLIAAVIYRAVREERVAIGQVEKV